MRSYNKSARTASVPTPRLNGRKAGESVISAQSNTASLPAPASTPICRIVIAVDINDANPNRLRSVRQKMRVSKAHKEQAALAWHLAGRPAASGQVLLDVIVRRPRKLDQGNVWAALKYCIDGIFRDALTPDDREEFLKLGSITQETSAIPEVVFVVYGVSGEWRAAA